MARSCPNGGAPFMNALDDQSLDQVAHYFRALAEPLRLKLLNALRDGSMNVSDLTSAVGSSQANVSKHLAVLAKAGLVVRRSRGTSAYYEIGDGRTYQLCDLVCGQIADRLLAQVQGMTGGAVPAKRAPGR